MKKIIFGILILAAIIYFSKLAPKDNTELYNKACDLADSCKYVEANKLLDIAIEYNPNDLECYNNRGWNFYDLKDYRNAKLNFDKILEIEPNNTIGFYGIGMINYKQKNYTIALKHFDKIIKLKGGGPIFPGKQRNDKSLDADIEQVLFYRNIVLEELKEIKPNR